MRTSPEAGSKRPLRSAVVCLTLVLLCVLAVGPAYGQAPSPTPTPSPTPPPSPPDRAATLKKQLAFEIDDPRVTVDVSILGDRTIVTLTGDLNTEQEEQDIVDLVEDGVPNGTQIRSRFFLKKPGTGARPAEEEITDLWNLTYIRSRVTPTGDEAISSASSNTRDSIEELVEAMNQAFDPGRHRAVKRAGRGRLLLRGTKDNLLKMKQFLALVDAPWPQVQMNLWAIQITGTPEKIASRVRLVTRQVRRTRDRMNEVQKYLTRTIIRPGETAREKAHWDFLEQQFDLAGIDLNPHNAQSLNEALVLLLLHPCRESKVQDLQSFIKSRRVTWLREDDQDWPDEASLLPRDRYRLALRLEETRRRQAEAFEQPFRRLHEVLRLEGYEAEREGFFDFRDALYCFNAPAADGDGYFDAPRRLVRTGATVDRMLKAAMDAFSADMADLFLDPLLGRIEASDPLGEADGVALVGKSRIVVTSGLEAGLEPQMVSFAETGRPQPFGKELLESAFPSLQQSSSGTTGGTAGGTTPPPGNLLGLPDAQALLLAAVLSADTTPSFTKVAPGVAIHVKPTVLPDGGAARIAIDAMFGVMSTAPTSGETGFFGDTPADAIESHHVQTDAAVSAFDLFDISSFALTASRPQAPFYVPVLGQLPVLGKAFQFPRKPKETHFESMLLINTVILPRSLELYRFYGRETEPPKISPELNPQVCCEGRRPPTKLKWVCDDTPPEDPGPGPACLGISRSAQRARP